MSHLIITGASRGIGAAIAAKFLAQGWRVLNLSRSKPKDERIEHINIDLADIEQVMAAQPELASFVAEASHTTVVHNAAAYTKDSIEFIDPDVFAKSLATNLVAPVQLNALILPFMQARDAIIYIGSTLSEKAVAGAASYVISKHAVVGMMRATCQDLALKQIHTCCICPGFTETEMMRDHLQHDLQLMDNIKSRVGAGRLIDPQEIAELTWFCCGNPVINGAVIHANLGQIEQ